MTKRHFWTFCLAFLLEILLLALQSTSRLLDRLEDGVELWERTDLNALYNAVTELNRAPLGGSGDFTLDLTKSAIYIVAYFYGSTVIITFDGQGVVISHYAQEQPAPGSNGQQSSVAMTNPTVVEENILADLLNAEMMVDTTNDTRDLIITSSGTGTVGYNLIKQNLETHGVEQGNIVPVAYVATSPFNDFTKGPIGKAAVPCLSKDSTSNVFSPLRNVQFSHLIDTDRFPRNKRDAVTGHCRPPLSNAIRLPHFLSPFKIVKRGS